MPLGGTLFDLTCGVLLGLFRLALCALSLGLAWLSFSFLRRALRKVRGPFIDGLYSPDLALQMIGRDGDLAPIVHHSGHLPLLRNLALDSKVFIPLYIVAFFAAILLLTGTPFAGHGWAVTPLAGMAMLLTLLGAVLDWRENAKLGEALRLNAAMDGKDNDRKRWLLGQAHRQAILKFICLGCVVAMLAVYSCSPAGPARLPGSSAFALSALFALAALGMLSCPLRPRYLEPAVAIAGLAIALLFTIYA